jgi:hypothetical protein
MTDEGKVDGANREIRVPREAGPPSLKLRRGKRAEGGINCDNGGEDRGYSVDGGNMDEQDFRKKSDAELESLKKRLLELGDEHGFEVEGSGERLELLF